MSSKARIDTHDEDEVNIWQNFECCFNRRTRIEDNTCGSSRVANSMEESVEMLDRFNVNGEVIATRINVVLIHRLCIFDHEMCIENRAFSEVLSKLFDDGWAEGQVWNEVPIHDVEMKPIKTCFNGFIACRTKGCKVGG